MELFDSVSEQDDSNTPKVVNFKPTFNSEKLRQHARAKLDAQLRELFSSKRDVIEIDITDSLAGLSEGNQDELDEQCNKETILYLLFVVELKELDKINDFRQRSYKRYEITSRYDKLLPSDYDRSDMRRFMKLYEEVVFKD